MTMRPIEMSAWKIYEWLMIQQKYWDVSAEAHQACATAKQQGWKHFELWRGNGYGGVSKGDYVIVATKAPAGDTKALTEGSFLMVYHAAPPFSELLAYRNRLKGIKVRVLAFIGFWLAFAAIAGAIFWNPPDFSSFNTQQIVFLLLCVGAANTWLSLTVTGLYTENRDWELQVNPKADGISVMKAAAA